MKSRCFALLILFGFMCLSLPAAGVDIALDKSAYAPGDTMVLSVAVTASEVAADRADVWVACVLPDKSVFFLISGAPWEVVDIPTTTLQSIPLAGLPDGSYAWYLVLTSAGADVADQSNWLAHDTAAFTYSAGSGDDDDGDAVSSGAYGVAQLAATFAGDLADAGADGTPDLSGFQDSAQNKARRLNGPGTEIPDGMGSPSGDLQDAYGDIPGEVPTNVPDGYTDGIPDEYKDLIDQYGDVPDGTTPTVDGTSDASPASIPGFTFDSSTGEWTKEIEGKGTAVLVFYLKGESDPILVDVTAPASYMPGAELYGVQPLAGEVEMVITIKISRTFGAGYSMNATIATGRIPLSPETLDPNGEYSFTGSGTVSGDFGSYGAKSISMTVAGQGDTVDGTYRFDVAIEGEQYSGSATFDENGCQGASITDAEGNPAGSAIVDGATGQFVFTDPDGATQVVTGLK